MTKVIHGNDHYPCAEVFRRLCLLEKTGERNGMTNGVLCIIDFTVSSKGVLKCAALLSKKFNKHLTILYTYRILKQNGEATVQKKQSEEIAFRNFASLEKEVLAGEGLNYDFKTEIGFINNRAEDHIKKNNISLLVIDRGLSVRNKEPFDDLIGKLKIPYVIVP